MIVINYLREFLDRLGFEAWTRIDTVSEWAGSREAASIWHSFSRSRRSAA